MSGWSAIAFASQVCVMSLSNWISEIQLWVWFDGVGFIKDVRVFGSRVFL